MRGVEWELRELERSKIDNLEAPSESIVDSISAFSSLQTQFA